VRRILEASSADGVTPTESARRVALDYLRAHA
jgi:hypothetical protein